MVMDSTDRFNRYSSCSLCPRRCKADRTAGRYGRCGMGSDMVASRASLHAWEEPCISGSTGSGTVFFCGCGLQCVYCQNAEISSCRYETDETLKHGWKKLSPEELSDIFFRLESAGACNINLVTPTHFTPGIACAIELEKTKGLKIPFVWNSSGYELPETIRSLDGLIDIYLTDCKYYSCDMAKRYSDAPDYFKWCSRVLKEMVRQTGEPVFTPVTSGSENNPGIISAAEYNDIIAEEPDEDSDYNGPLMLKGTIIRHLVLPGQPLIQRADPDDEIRHIPKDSADTIDYLIKEFGNSVYISLMSQYTPMPCVSYSDFPELSESTDPDIYSELVDHAIAIGLENGFFQAGAVDDASFIPAFDGTGL